MSWSINYSSQAQKFLKKNPAHSDHLKESLRLFVKKLTGEVVSLDVDKMKGEWKGHIRIRKGGIRMIISVDEDLMFIHVKVIDFRGNVYK